MRKRLLYISGLVVLILSAVLTIWQGSFSFGDYAPASPEQTLLYWGVSTLVFLLTVTLGFMLFRTTARLYVERRSNREGSRLKTKLVMGALALTTMPVFFLVFWGYSVLNYNLAKWFSRPAEGVRQNFEEVLNIVEGETRARAAAQAAWLAARVSGAGSLEEACKSQGIAAAAVARAGDPVRMICGDRKDLEPSARAEISGGGQVLVAARPPAELAAREAQIRGYMQHYDRLAIDRRSTRNFYLLLMALITLFIVFFATWIAMFLAKHISNPIAALLEAAGQVRQGNLAYRVEARATDELATLVRAFNDMTRDLEANSLELERRRRFTEAILESIPSGVISVASDGRILRANRALKQLFGDGKVTQAARLEDLFPRDETAEIRYMMKRARRTGAASRQFDVAAERGTLHLSVTVAAIEERLTSGFVIVLEDTSDLLRAQKTAAWHEVARRIAHEIKNPLTPIALSSDRIARQIERLDLPPEKARIVRECTATISNEVESVKSLVDAFSQFARFPAAQPLPSDLNEVVENALAVFAGRLEGIDIIRELGPALPPVNIDREQFKRVVVNLVDNAAESMQDSLLKRLLVATQLTIADTVELIVADTGCGVSPEDKDRLFLPYFSTKGRGTGLGLAIVSHIVTEHNGSIRVEDNIPQGARFIIEIPATVSEAESRAVEVRA